MSHKIPFEILKKTFSLLNDNDLKECRTTCKQWNRAALEQMRETFCFYNVSEESAPELIQILESTSPEILGRVKHINLDLTKKSCDEDSEEPVFYWDIDDLLNTLLRLCPNIVKISSSAPPTMTEVWFCIREAIEKGYLQHLESIPTPLNEDMAFEYFPIAKAAKSKLKELCIRNDFLATSSIQLAVFNPINCNAGPFSDPWLQEFTEIEKLSFNWYCVDETLLDCDAMIENCSNSKKLKDVELIIRPLMNNFKEDPVPFLSYTVKPRPSIKHLKCSWEMIKCDSIVLYLMEKFPKLESFTLNMESNGWRFHKNLSVDILTSFMQYLSRIPTLDLNFFLQSNMVKAYLAAFDVHPEIRVEHIPNIVDSYEKVAVYRKEGNALDSTCRVSIFTSNPENYFNEKIPGQWKIV